MYIVFLDYDHAHNNPTGADSLQEITKSDFKGQNPEMQAVGKLREQISEILLHSCII